MKQWWNSGETGWIRMNQQQNNLFHGHETPWISMKQCVSWSRNTLFHSNETPFSYIDFWFMRLHTVPRCFAALFHAVSRCFKVFRSSVSRCFKVLHSSVSWYFKVFQGVSLLGFKLFHDHETGSVGTSLNSCMCHIYILETTALADRSR